MRIRDERCGGNAAELARRIKKDATYVNRLFYPVGKRGGKGVGLEIMAACNEAFSLPPGYWDGATDTALAGVANEPLPSHNDTDLTIPQYASGGAMGNGLVLEDKPPGLIKSWHVDEEWLRLNVRHHTGLKNLCIVTGFGPSMRGMFNPGDPLLCDRGVTTVEVDGVYFFRVGEHGFIKMLQRIPTPAGLIIRAKSKNPDYDPFDITEGMDFQVFAKVLTVWKSEQV